jgi:hypothetical protein
VTLYPDDLDDDSTMPDVAGRRQDGSDAAGVVLPAATHSRVLRVLQLASRALQAKVGRGTSTPAADRVLRGTAAGVSEWTPLSALPVTKLGVGAGTPGQAVVVGGDGQALGFTTIATATALQAHLDDTVDAHDATAISYAGSANLAATNVEAALDELDAEKETPAGAQAKATAAQTAATTAAATALQAHLDDAVDAHDATAISYAGSANLAATNVEAALDELDAEKETPAGAQANATAAQTAAATALQAHLDDTTDAHDATAISYAGSATLAATNVEAALDELDAEKETPAGAQEKVATHAAGTGAGKHVAQQPAIANLALVVSDPPTQAQVQQLATKVDAILGALRTAGVLTP